MAGGQDIDELVVSSRGRNVQCLCSTQEEADTRIVLHAVDAAKKNFQRVIFISRDTDVLVLMVMHATTPEVWLSAGTGTKPRYVPVHTIKQTLTPEILAGMPAFHALTGCDTTSRMFGTGKKTAWKVFISNIQTLVTFGTGSQAAIAPQLKSAEAFVIKMYSSNSSAELTDSLRATMFHSVSEPERLPPTSNALHFHMLRCWYQVQVWRQANISRPLLPDPLKSGWKIDKGHFIPILMTKDPMPSMCHELVTCKCKSGCNRRCGCKAKNLPCTAACDCNQECLNPHNPHSAADSSESSDSDD